MKQRILKKFIKRGVYCNRIINKFMLYWHRQNIKDVYYTLGNHVINRHRKENNYDTKRRNRASST